MFFKLGAFFLKMGAKIIILGSRKLAILGIIWTPASNTYKKVLHFPLGPRWYTPRWYIPKGYIPRWYTPQLNRFNSWRHFRPSAERFKNTEHSSLLFTFGVFCLLTFKNYKGVSFYAKKYVWSFIIFNKQIHSNKPNILRLYKHKK